MKGNRKRDTRPEVALRSGLHRRGARFRCDYRIQVPGYRVVRVDIAFPKRRIAVFVDGCFWHSCPEHGNLPKANRNYWSGKLARTVDRDREVDSWLAAIGWTSVHVWEHEPLEEAVRHVIEILRAGSSMHSGRRSDVRDSLTASCTDP